MMVLHPMHTLFRQCLHPNCPVCQREIIPLTPVEIEWLDDGRFLVRHAECGKNPIAALNEAQRIEDKEP